MKFFLKVLMLVGIIAVGKWEKESSVNASKRLNSATYPVFSQNADTSVLPKQKGESGFDKISVEYKY